MGLRRVGVGWLLGMGSCGECVAYALASSNRVPSFGHDRGKETDAASVERPSDHLDVRTVHFRHLFDSFRNCFIRPCLREFQSRPNVRYFPRSYSCR